MTQWVCGKSKTVSVSVCVASGSVETWKQRELFLEMFVHRIVT